MKFQWDAGKKRHHNDGSLVLQEDAKRWCGNPVQVSDKTMNKFIQILYLE